MNAAFLLVASACCVGADAPVQPTPTPTPTPTATVVAPAAPCGCAAESCCEKHGLFARWKAKWGHHDSCGCDTCAQPAPVVHYAPAPTFHAKSCDTCDACATHKKWSWPRFGKHHDCECDTCGSAPIAGAPIITVPPTGTTPKMEKAPESISPPKGEKKLPEGTVAPTSLQQSASLSPAKEESKNPFELDRRYQARVDRAADYSWLTGQLFYVHTDGGQWVLRYAAPSDNDPNGGGVVLVRDRQMDSYRNGDLVKVQGAVLNASNSKTLGAPMYRATSIQLLDRGE